MPNMAFSSVGEFLLTVHNDKPPTDAEWSEWVNMVKQRDPDRIRNLVFTAGGAPNSTQRKAVTEALKGKSVPCAVVTASNLVRGVVTALGWFNSKIKTFPPDQTEIALQYLGMPIHDIPKVMSEIRRLRALVGDDRLKGMKVR